MREAVVVMAKRTPIGKVGGQLKTLEPHQLAAALIREILNETTLPGNLIDDVILGNVIGPGGNIARVSALEAGLPVTVPGLTVDRQCGSGLEAINLAARLVQSGAGEVYLAGGVESVSRAPWKMKKPSTLEGYPEIYPRAPFTPEAFGDPDMGIAAENIANHFGISRKEQDHYALKSHQKSVHAIQTGKFHEEIVPLFINNHRIDTDECPRANTSYEKLQSLQPVFLENGTVTAGNACPINDGAAIVLVMSMDKCRSLELQPVLKIIDAQVSGVDPHILGIGPVPAVRKILQRNHLTEKEIDLVEFNEAFASQVLASLKELHLPEEKVNVAGGALALGHPYGASGAILMTRLFHEIKDSSHKFGLATLGVGGGMGIATLVEAVQ